MIKLIREDALLEKYSGRDFINALLEFLKKTDVIKYADDYIDNFDPSKKQQYAQEYPIKDIKDDLAKYIEEWLKDIQEDCDIYRMENNRKSKQYGFSNYITLSFNRPADRRLYQFYRDNDELYNNVKFRFSEHTSRNDDSDITEFVNLTGKTFLQAADEMKFLIKNYVIDLRAKEKQYLKKLAKADKKKRR
jgi:hypothetical protein